MRATTGVFPPGQSQWASRSLSCKLRPVRMICQKQHQCGGLSWTPILGAVAQSEYNAELVAMLDHRAGMESSALSRASALFGMIGIFFPEVHEELIKSCKAPFTVRSCFAGTSTLTTLDGEVAKVYTEVPQVECVVVLHLCSQNAATWCNRLRA